MTRVQAQHGPEKASALSVIVARQWASKSRSPSKATSQFSRNSALLVARALLLLCFCFAPCCHDPSIVRSASNLSTVPWCHSVCASVSMFTSTLTTVCFCSCAGVSKSAASAPDPSSALRLHLVVECGIHAWSCRGPILQVEQHCSTEATIGFFFKICAILLLLDTEVFFLNLFLYPKVSPFFVFPSLFCFRSIRHRIRRFSSIRCCPALNRRFRFRSVVPDLCHRISYGTLHWYKFEFTSLAHWLDHWPNVSLLRQNPTCLGPTNLRLVASVLFRIKLRLPSSQTSVAS